MIERANLGEALGAGLVMNPGVDEPIKSPRFIYEVECVGADGNVKWVERIENLVTTEGKNDILDKYFKGASYTAAWFLGLKGTGSAAVGDTLASHAGWSEVNPYAGNRPAITFGTTAAGSNTATAVSYSCNGSATVAGAFVSSVNTGTSGKLYSAGDFAASRAVVSGDTLNVTLTVSAS
jgi:hypothetical protein